MKPNNIEIKELSQCPIKAHKKRCDDKKKKLLREAILERGQHFGRVMFCNTWGHKIYTRIGGDDLFRDLPEQGSVNFKGTGVSPVSQCLPETK